MSGHDIAAKPHKTTHEVVRDEAPRCPKCGHEITTALMAAVCPLRKECEFYTEGIEEWYPENRLPAIPVQWTRWPNVGAHPARYVRAPIRRSSRT